MEPKAKASREALLEALPFARWAFYELLAVALLALAAVAVLCWLGPPWLFGAPIPLVIAWAVALFYRDPSREVTIDPQAFLSPADGRVVSIEELKHDAFLNGPAVRVHIYLSMWDVHVNRAPRDAMVIDTNYRAGRHVDARNPAMTELNESMWIGFEQPDGRRFAVRQIAGLVARRIACDLRPGDSVRAGDKFGMIKLGSGVEVVMPGEVSVECQAGDRVTAGVTILARYADEPTA